MRDKELFDAITFNDFFLVCNLGQCFSWLNAVSLHHKQKADDS